MTRGDEPNSVISCWLHLSWSNRKAERVITGNDTAEFCFKSWHCIPVEEEEKGGEGGGGEEEEEKGGEEDEEEKENHGEYDRYLLPK